MAAFDTTIHSRGVDQSWKSKELQMKQPRFYAVGYGRPPVNTRFKPGQSGNAKGRPKGRKKMFALLQDALDKRILIREGDSVRKVSTREAIILALMSKALKGDTKTFATIIALTQQSGEFERESPHIVRVERVIIDPDGRETDITDYKRPKPPEW
jgi:hypothetical protein